MFKFQLRHYKKRDYLSVRQGILEDKEDAMDIATTVIGHYGCKDASRVTRDILNKINQRDLGSQVESNMSKKTDKILIQLQYQSFTSLT